MMLIFIRKENLDTDTYKGKMILDSGRRHYLHTGQGEKTGPAPSLWVLRTNPAEALIMDFQSPEL